MDGGVIVVYCEPGTTVRVFDDEGSELPFPDINRLPVPPVPPGISIKEFLGVTGLDKIGPIETTPRYPDWQKENSTS